MAVDVFCYVAYDQAIANKLVHKLKLSRRDFFAINFSLSSARDTAAIHNAIAIEAGFPKAKAIFLIHLNNKDAAAEILQAAEVVREHFGAPNILLLLENEKKL